MRYLTIILSPINPVDQMDILNLISNINMKLENLILITQIQFLLVMHLLVYQLGLMIPLKHIAMN